MPEQQENQTEVFHLKAPFKPTGDQPQAIEALVQGLKAAAADAGIALSADSEGGMFGFFLLPELPQNYAQVMQTEGARFNRLFHGLLERGVYIAPALYEAGFVSAAHSEEDIAVSYTHLTLPTSDLV